ncbi:MAG: Uma2 family endonuclease [Candidatus Eremiobacteraeota bacterium]|nr:Uma2 family endonuclease [Candidatus Eremiobacteraeota bacterium]
MLVLPLPQRRFTAAEYLRLESDSATRSEFHDGVIYAMTGGSLDHNRIVCNLVHQLRLGLEGSACEVFSSDVRLAVQAHQLFTYPDVMVVCGSPALLEGRNDTLTDAKLIIAVLSPSTETYDRDQKFRFYRALPSLEEYVTVAQSSVLVEQHQRQSGGTWLLREHHSLSQSLALQSVGVHIGLEQIYQNLDGL